MTTAAKTLPAGEHPAEVEPFGLDATDREGLERLASRVTELGTLRAVAHAAGISPTMADWRRVVTVDLVGSALLIEALRPLATTGTALVWFASMAPLLGAAGDVDPAIDAALDDPLDPGLLDRLHCAAGTAIEDPGMAYMWAKRGVQRLVRREAVRLGPLGARICSVSPGIIDTPMGRRRRRLAPPSTTRSSNTRRWAARAAPRRWRRSWRSYSPTRRASSTASTSPSTAASSPPSAPPRPAPAVVEQGSRHIDDGVAIKTTSTSSARNKRAPMLAWLEEAPESDPGSPRVFIQ